MLRALRLLLPPCIFLGITLPVIVTLSHAPRPDDVRPAVPVLPATGAWYGAAKVLLQEEAVVQSPESALRLLRMLMRTDRRVSPFCHGLSHEVGHAAFRVYGFSGAVALHDDLCGSGYIHGVVERALGEETDLPAAALRYCGEENPVCYHGVGHGFMAALENDAVGAVSQCKVLPLPLQRIKCAEGVYMERFSPEGSPHPPEIDLASALKECIAAGEPYDSACAYYAPRAYLAKHTDDARGAIEWCRDRGGTLKFYCMRGVGAMLMKRHIAEPLHVEGLCTSANTKEEAQTCVAGMVSYWVVHHASTERGHELCGLLQEPFRLVCKKTVLDGREAYPEE